MSSHDLAEQVVLITGGTGGLGRATAQALLARGARVALVDVHPRTAELAADLSKRALGVTADVTDRPAMDAAVAAVIARFGRIDVAIAADANRAVDWATRLLESAEDILSSR